MRHSHFGHDAEALVIRMREALGEEVPVARERETLGDEKAGPSRWRVRAAIGAAAVAALLLIGWGGNAFIQHMLTTVEQTVQQREVELKAELVRQAGAAAEAEEKRKVEQAEQQRWAAVKAEQERQATAAAEAEAKRKAEESTAPRLTKADVVKLFARLSVILQRVRNDYVDAVDERKLLRGAIQGMENALPFPSPVSSAGRLASTGGDIGGTIDLNAIYDTALTILNARTTERDDAPLAEAAIKGLFAELDPRSYYMDQKTSLNQQQRISGAFGGIGIEVSMVEGGRVKVIAPLDDTPSAKAGVRSGDVITQINGDQVQGLTLNQATEKMRGPVGTKVRLTLERNGLEKPIYLTIERATIQIRSVRSRTVGGDVGYIRITLFNEHTTEDLKKALADLQTQIAANTFHGYIIDLRNNPGGLLARTISVSDEFLDNGEIVSTRGRKPEYTKSYYAKPGDSTEGRPIIALINGGTAAASEILAGALQDNKRATIIGTRSFGQGTAASIFPLDGDNGAIQLTTSRYYTPSGHSIQVEGIVPDIEVLQEVPDEIKSRAQTKGETALRGHLPGQGEGQSGSQSYIPPDAKDDKALNMALDLLRGTQVNSAFPPNSKRKMPN